MLLYENTKSKRTNHSHPHPRLPIMAVLAKGLPVCFVPEKPHVSAMGYNMVHHSRSHQLTSPLTLHTKRISLEIGTSGNLPAAIITPCSSALPGIKPPMCLTVDSIAKGGAPRMTAGTFGFHRHHITSKHEQSPGVVHRLGIALVLHCAVKGHD